VGWFQYEPAGTDVGTVQAVIHTGEAKIPDATKKNYIAYAQFSTPNVKTTNWVRFSVPFKYENGDIPEYILLILTSGNGTSAVDKSVAYFDDIELVYNHPLNIEEENPLNAVSIYGSQNGVNFDFTNLTINEEINLQVFDLMGKEQVNESITSNEMTSFDNMTPGIYVCVVEMNGQVYRKKVIVR